MGFPLSMSDWGSVNNSGLDKGLITIVIMAVTYEL